MNLLKKTQCILGALLLGAAIPLCSAATSSYPEHLITIVVPFPAGGPSDAIARMVAQSLSDSMKVPVVTENIPGAGSTIGTAKVANAKPDGYTLLWASSSALVIAPHLYPSLRYDSLKSFAPVSWVASAPYVLLVNAGSPYKTLADLVKKAKEKPGELNFGSPGAGTSLHLANELFVKDAGIHAEHIAYKGSGPAMIALIAGDVGWLVDVPSIAIPMAQSGRARALAVTSAQRLPDLPEVPTLTELGFGTLETRAWFALMAPAGTPPEVISQLNDQVRQALANPRVIASMKTAGFDPAASTPKELASTIRTEYERWGNLIRERNLILR